MNAPVRTGFVPEPTDRDQRVFRAMLRAVSYPGLIVPLPPVEAPQPLCPAIAAMLLGMLDRGAGLWLAPELDCEEVRSFLRFRSAAEFVASTRDAVFAVIADAAAMPPLAQFHPGEPAFPDRSATVFVRVPTLTAGPSVALRGPGIEDIAVVSPGGLAEGFWADWQDNHARYPLGVDIFMTDGEGVLGLPRTVTVR